MISFLNFFLNLMSTNLYYNNHLQTINNELYFYFKQKLDSTQINIRQSTYLLNQSLVDILELLLRVHTRIIIYLFAFQENASKFCTIHNMIRKLRRTVLCFHFWNYIFEDKNIILYLITKFSILLINWHFLKFLVTMTDQLASNFCFSLSLFYIPDMKIRLRNFHVFCSFTKMNNWWKYSHCCLDCNIPIFTCLCMYILCTGTLSSRKYHYILLYQCTHK